MFLPGCLIFFIVHAHCFPEPRYFYNDNMNQYQERPKYIHPLYYGEMEDSRQSRLRRFDSINHYEHQLRQQKKFDIVRPAYYGAVQYTTKPPLFQAPGFRLVRRNELIDKTNPRSITEVYTDTNETPNYVTSIAELFSKGKMGGYDYFNKDGANDYNNLNKNEMYLRPRRHENIMNMPLEIHTMAKIEEITTLKTTTEIPTTQNPTLTTTTTLKPESLQNIINELKRALTFIQTHTVEEIKKEPITQNTPTEELIKYITSSVETLRKTKDTGLRSIFIKDISIALEIILSRIVRSTNELMKANSTIAEHYRQEHITKKDLMMKILHKLQHSKINRDVEILDLQLENKNVSKPEKIVEEDNGGEVVDEIRSAKFGLEDDNINAIDGDVNKDTEQITQGPFELTTTRLKDVTARQEQGSSEEGGGNFVANLLSSFLGSLSNAEGGVDVDAVVGLVSGLSVQREDGTYDFTGLTETLQSFLAPDEDGTGGSDVPSFLGGLVGAVLQGSAQPPGPMGVGKLTGNVVAYLLPGLSGPAPSSSEDETNKRSGLDSGSFLAGLLTSMLGASSSGSSGSSSGSKSPDNGGKPGGEGSVGFFTMIKNGLFKSIFSIITSVLTSSAGAASSTSAGLSTHISQGSKGSKGH